MQPKRYAKNYAKTGGIVLISLSLLADPGMATMANAFTVRDYAPAQSTVPTLFADQAFTLQVRNVRQLLNRSKILFQRTKPPLRQTRDVMIQILPTLTIISMWPLLNRGEYLQVLGLAVVSALGATFVRGAIRGKLGQERSQILDPFLNFSMIFMLLWPNPYVTFVLAIFLSFLRTKSTWSSSPLTVAQQRGLLALLPIVIGFAHGAFVYFTPVWLHVGGRSDWIWWGTLGVWGSAYLLTSRIQIPLGWVIIMAAGATHAMEVQFWGGVPNVLASSNGAVSIGDLVVMAAIGIIMADRAAWRWTLRSDASGTRPSSRFTMRWITASVLAPLIFAIPLLISEDWVPIRTLDHGVYFVRTPSLQLVGLTELEIDQKFEILWRNMLVFRLRNELSRAFSDDTITLKPMIELYAEFLMHPEILRGAYDRFLARQESQGTLSARDIDIALQLQTAMGMAMVLKQFVSQGELGHVLRVIPRSNSYVHLRAIRVHALARWESRPDLKAADIEKLRRDWADIERFTDMKGMQIWFPELYDALLNPGSRVSGSNLPSRTPLAHAA